MTNYPWPFLQAPEHEQSFIVRHPTPQSAPTEALAVYDAAVAAGNEPHEQHQVWTHIRHLFSARAKEYLLLSEDIGAWLAPYEGRYEISTKGVFDGEPLRLTFLDRDAAVLFKLTWL